MASPTQLTETISQTLGIGWATCDSTWKELRSNNMVVNSGRGKRGTQVTARDCAVFLIALCGADHVKDSVGAAETYGNCVHWHTEHDEPISFAPLAPLGPDHTLLDAVEAIIEAYKLEKIPVIEMSMVLPDGGLSTTHRSHTKPSVFLVLTTPPSDFPAHIDVDRQVIAEYQRRKSVEEMFGDVGEGSKRRVVAKGDLRIEKRISTATFTKLGELLRANGDKEMTS